MSRKIRRTLSSSLPKCASAVEVWKLLFVVSSSFLLTSPSTERNSALSPFPLLQRYGKSGGRMGERWNGDDGVWTHNTKNSSRSRPPSAVRRWARRRFFKPPSVQHIFCLLIFRLTSCGPTLRQGPYTLTEP